MEGGLNLKANDSEFDTHVLLLDEPAVLSSLSEKVSKDTQLPQPPKPAAGEALPTAVPSLEAKVRGVSEDEHPFQRGILRSAEWYSDAHELHGKRHRTMSRRVSPTMCGRQVSA